MMASITQELGSARYYFVCFLCFIMSGTAAAVEIRGCEADDIAALLAPSGYGTWQARVVDIGAWRVAHSTDVACKTSTCTLNGGLLVVDVDETRTWLAQGVGARRSGAVATVLPTSSSTLAQAWEFTDSIAEDVTSAIRGSSYPGDENHIHYAWVDYGRLAKVIRVRGRTEIACEKDEQHCLLQTTMLIFVGYDENNECGDYAREARF